MSDDEKQMALALVRCTFCPGIGTKRFARDMGQRAASPEPAPLTPKQRRYLAEAVIRYRRQIARETVAVARAYLETLT